MSDDNQTTDNSENTQPASKLKWGIGLTILALVVLGLGAAYKKGAFTSNDGKPVADAKDTKETKDGDGNNNPPPDASPVSSATTANNTSSTAAPDKNTVADTPAQQQTEPSPIAGFRQLADTERLTLERLKAIVPTLTAAQVNDLFVVIPQMTVLPQNESNVVEVHYTVDFQKAQALGLNNDQVTRLNALRVSRARYRWDPALKPDSGASSMYNVSSIRVTFPDDGIATFAIDAGKKDDAPLVLNRTTGAYYGLPTQ